MTTHQNIKWMTIGISAMAIVLVAGILIYEYIKPPSKEEQVSQLIESANHEADLIAGGTYTKADASSSCWDYWVSGKDSFKRRSCSHGFEMRTDKTKEAIARNALDNGWTRNVYDRGTKVERISYSNKEHSCTMDDRVPNKIGPETGKYYRIYCGNSFNETIFGRAD